MDNERLVPVQQVKSCACCRFNQLRISVEKAGMLTSSFWACAGLCGEDGAVASQAGARICTTLFCASFEALHVSCDNSRPSAFTHPSFSESIRPRSHSFPLNFPSSTPSLSISSLTLAFHSFNTGCALATSSNVTSSSLLATS